MTSYKERPEFSYSDNRLIKVRRALNYENNLRRHNRNDFPWRLVTVDSKARNKKEDSE